MSESYQFLVTVWLLVGLAATLFAWLALSFMMSSEWLKKLLPRWTHLLAIRFCMFITLTAALISFGAYWETLVLHIKTFY